MAHRTIKSGYFKLADRLNRYLQGALLSDLFQVAYEHNLVQFGENIRENVNFIHN